MAIGLRMAGELAKFRRDQNLRKHPKGLVTK